MSGRLYRRHVPRSTSRGSEWCQAAHSEKDMSDVISLHTCIPVDTGFPADVCWAWNVLVAYNGLLGEASS